MRRKLTWLGVSIAIAVAVFYYAGNAWATAGSGFTATTLYKGTFSDFSVLNEYPPLFPGGKAWMSSQQTQGPSDLYIQQNTWTPAGTTGWHTHPGHSLIMVTEGTVTDYEGDDPNCTPHVYTKGMTLIDSGGLDHTHIIRNETDSEAQTIAVQLIPQGAPRRIDRPDPGNCHF